MIEPKAWEWRLSAGDEHTVFDGNGSKIASVPCGGMSGRTFGEAAECAKLIAEAPYNRARVEALQAENERLRALVIQYRDDLRRPPTGDSLERRLSAINQALEASCIETWPKEPKESDVVWYRGWECGWDEEANKWTNEPWRAYKGGADLDAPQVSGRTWEDLLCEIDAEEDDD